MLYGWKENSMLTNCLAACAHLTITVSEIERDIGRKSSFFHTPLHSTPPLGGSHRNSATPFGMEKLEWCGYPTVKKMWRYVYSFWHDPRTWQTHTHRRTDTGWRHRPRLCIASRGKNWLMACVSKLQLAKVGAFFWDTAYNPSGIPGL